MSSPQQQGPFQMKNSWIQLYEHFLHGLARFVQVASSSEKVGSDLDEHGSHPSGY